MWFEANAAFVQFSVETFNVRLEKRSLNLDRQIANAHVKQMVIG